MFLDGSPQGRTAWMRTPYLPETPDVEEKAQADALPRTRAAKEDYCGYNTLEDSQVKENILKVVSLDGHRISIRNIALKESYESHKVIVPGKTLSEISKILGGDNEKEVQIFFSKNHILFEFDDTMVVSRLIDGEYFKIDHMLSSDYETRVKVNKREFMDSIDRSMILIRDSDRKPIILNVEDSNVNLKVRSTIGSMNADVSAYKAGKDIMIAFNPKFLLDALRVIDDEEVELYMMNPKSPCFIKDEEGTYIYLILPVNFINEG